MSDIQNNANWFSDDQLLRRVVNFLEAKGLVPQWPLRIRVEAGVVQLGGVADDRVVQQAMEQYCRRVAGVLAIQFDRVAFSAVQRSKRLARLERPRPNTARESWLKNQGADKRTSVDLDIERLPVLEGALS